MAIPSLSAAQRRAASVKAVAARRRRADVRADLKAARIGLGEVMRLSGTDEAIASMRVRELIAALPRYGPRRTAAAMDQLDVAANRRLRGLGAVQRAALLQLGRSPS